MPSRLFHQFVLICMVANPITTIASPCLHGSLGTAKPVGELQRAVELLKGGQFVKAEMAFKKILSRTNQNDIIYSADVLNYVGVSLHAQKKESEAERFFDRAIAKLASLDRKSKLMRAKVLANLAGVYSAQRKTAQALQTLEQSTKLFREAGNCPKELAVALVSYGNLEMAQHNFAAAEKFLRESIDLREKTLGKNSIELVSPMVNLSSVYLEQKEYSKAEQLCLRTIAICQSSGGKQCALLFPLFSNLAEVQKEQKKMTAALLSFKQALNAAEINFGERSEEFLASLLSLSETAEACGQQELSLKSMKRAVEVCRSNFGPQDERFLLAAEALADLEQVHGNVAEAQRLRTLCRISRRR